jgi:serine/threonine protein kinase
VIPQSGTSGCDFEDPAALWRDNKEHSMIGQSVLHYKILEKLGEGGMGVVYKAEDTKLKRTVALKFLPRGLEAHEPERARFLQEAQAASALNHPNVCTIYDILEERDQHFIVMEYVDGVTLRQKLESGKLKVETVVQYAIQIGEALEEAHSKGVVHRDVKTDNIMVTSKNQVKVMDFGLAKLKGSLKLTKTSSTVGTLAYMAPEQIQGGEIDSRSDIFSFGVVLYEMLTGQLPFRGEHEAAMIYSIVNEPPESIQKYLPDISPEFVHVLNRALEKDPEERYQSVHDMVIDLRRLKKETSRVSHAPLVQPTTEKGSPAVLEKQEMGSATERRTRQSPLLWAGLVGALVLLAALMIFVFSPKQATRLNANPTVRTLEIPMGQIGYPSISRDGSWIAFSARDEKNEWSVYFMNVAKGTPRRLTTEPFAEVGYAEISPDNSELLYDRVPPGMQGGIYLISSLGGTGQKILEPATSGRWRSDGKLIGYIRGLTLVPSQSGKREFWTVNPDGSDNRLEFVDTLSYRFGNFCFDWSPDGKSIAWLRSFPGYSEIIIRNLQSGQERQLTSFKKGINEVAWASNDRIFFSSSRSGNTNIWMIPASGGEAAQVTKGSGPDIGVRISADGKRLLYLEQRMISHVWIADIDGQNARQVTFDNQSIDWPSFSPDKERISFSMSSADLLRPGSHIFIMQSDGSSRTQLNAGDFWFFVPTWSPDGKYLAYGSVRTDEPRDSARVFLTEAANPSTPRLVGKGVFAWWIDAENFLTFTPLFFAHTHSTLYNVNSRVPKEVSEDSTWQFPLHDGKHVLIGDLRKGKEGWWLKSRVTRQGEEPKQILSSEYLMGTWPTASLRYLLYQQSNGELWRMSLPNGKKEHVPDTFRGRNPLGGFEVQMSYDDKEAVFLKGRLDARLVLIENLFE